MRGAGGVAHADGGSKLRPQGLADVAGIGWITVISSCLPCVPRLGWPVFLAPDGPVAVSHFKTNVVSARDRATSIAPGKNRLRNEGDGPFGTIGLLD